MSPWPLKEDQAYLVSTVSLQLHNPYHCIVSGLELNVPAVCFECTKLKLELNVHNFSY